MINLDQGALINKVLDQGETIENLHVIIDRNESLIADLENQLNFIRDNRPSISEQLKKVCGCGDA